jgi:hypothetical protein
MDGYDIAQVCKNGHVISSTAGSNPEFRKNFCNKCGERTMMQCESCLKPIKGYYHVEGVLDFSMTYHLPIFCDNCGNPFPWTGTKLKASKDLINFIETISDDEKDDFRLTIEQLIRETSDAPIAKVKFKRYIKRIESDLAKSIKELLLDIVSNSIKPAILEA